MAGEAVQGIAPFRWTIARVNAAEAVAADKETDEAIAASVGVSLRTFYYWKAHPDFAARVAELVQAAEEEARRSTILNKQYRLEQLADRQRRMAELIAARAKQHADIPGGTTGLLVAEPKIVKILDQKRRDQARGRGTDGDTDYAAGEEGEQLTPTGRVVIMFMYKADTALLAEMRNTEKQAAQELGEWSEKKELTGPDGEPPFKVYLGFDPNEV